MPLANEGKQLLVCLPGELTRDISDTMPLPEPSVLPPGTWTVLVDVARMKARC